MLHKDYWSGKVALICSYCREYRSFPSVEELKEHIQKEHEKEIKKMASESWVCLKCGKVGGFILMGSGFIMCSACGTWHMVPASGNIYLVGKATPELIPYFTPGEEANCENIIQEPPLPQNS